MVFEEQDLAAAVEKVISRRFKNLDADDVRQCAVEVATLVDVKTLAHQPVVDTFPERAEVIAVRGWKRFIPVGFVLFAWFGFWLVWCGCNRRTWLKASEIAVECTVALAVGLFIWARLDRQFGQ